MIQAHVQAAITGMCQNFPILLVCRPRVIAMVSKTHSKPPKAMGKGIVTIVEMVVVMAVLLIFMAVVLMEIDLPEKHANARDVKRVSDLSLLDSAINQYRMDNRNYPDTTNILRISTLLPSGGTQLQNASSGWIKQDMSKYLPRMPTDPLNDATYYYSYIHNSSGYELDAKLELLTNQMQNDGGNDPNMYEIGTNLMLISP
jgi:type II secretory pathway pseudopilin PulG